MRIVALVPDLMDRSRISASIPDVSFAQNANECEGAEVVIVDLARRAGEIATVRSVAPRARIVAFGPHVDTAGQAEAVAAGADVVLARSKFFADVSSAIR